MVVKQATSAKQKPTTTKASTTKMASSDNIPSDALMQLIQPDGYYTYFDIPKPAATSTSTTESHWNKDNETNPIDEDVIKKKYRKLSLKHHPDKTGGDADTFRVLHRAQKVLKDPKLRRQYDILGLDLDDDDDDTTAAGGTTKEGDEDPDAKQGIVHEVATMLMAALMHLAIKTAMMCAVATLVVRYRITLLPACLFLLYICYTILQEVRLPDNHPNKRSILELMGPATLILGLVCMYLGQARSGFLLQLLFWVGESAATFMFLFNSLRHQLPMGPPILAGMAFVAALLALLFRGKFWNYFIALLFEGGLLLIVVVAFPVMEMMLETILNEKLKKVGDKVRAHQKQMELYYRNKT